ncbi:MAG: hypothetical protein ACKOHM_08925 [Spartobacteria bacterium]
MSDSRSKKINTGAIRTLFLSCFGALLILELGLALLALRYNAIQNGILVDQAVLLRTREILGDALRDAQAAWKYSNEPGTTQPAPVPSESADKASECMEMLKKLKRPALVFPASDLDRLDDIVTNNAKLLAADPPYNAEQKALREKTDKALTGFIAAIDIRLFASMQEFRREVEFLEMVGWGLIPLLILSTAAFGILLLSKVMEPLMHLKKQSRKLTDTVVTLQNELRLAHPHQQAPAAPAPETQASTEAGPQGSVTQTP